MRIVKDALFTLAREGRITLQIPALAISFGDVSSQEQEFPDEWFSFLRDGIPATGKQQGFVYWSRAGWEANKDEIKKVFCAAGCSAYWTDFEQHAKEHFESVAKKRDVKIKKLRKELAELEATNV